MRVELSNNELFTLYLASLNIRSAGRSIEFAMTTMDTVRDDAEKAIGGDVYTFNRETRKLEAKQGVTPPGRLDQLAVLEARVLTTIDSAIQRKNLPPEAKE